MRICSLPNPSSSITSANVYRHWLSACRRSPSPTIIIQFVRDDANGFTVQYRRYPRRARQIRFAVLPGLAVNCSTASQAIHKTPHRARSRRTIFLRNQKAFFIDIESGIEPGALHQSTRGALDWQQTQRVVLRQKMAAPALHRGDGSHPKGSLKTASPGRHSNWFTMSRIANAILPRWTGACAA